MTTLRQLGAHGVKYGDDLMHLDTSRNSVDQLPPMPPAKIALASPQPPPAADPIMPEDPELPLFDDILPLP
ncbi:MAG: hypothetical protein PHI71_17660 [Acidiphilium sp.]|jgi:hypothetical protein|nr:hypothetical protein [Acidiphilium sp.]